MFGTVQRLLSPALVARDRDDADQRPLPSVLEADLSNGYVEAAAKPVLQTAQYLTLILERLRMGDVELKREEPNGDGSSGHDAVYTRTSWATFSVANSSITSPCLMSP